MTVFVNCHRVRLLAHLDVSHLHVVVQVDDLDGMVAFMRGSIGVIVRPVADIKLITDLYHLFGGVAHLDAARMGHVLRIDNPEIGANQVGDVCLVGRDEVHLTRRAKVGEHERLTDVAFYGIGIHLINIIAVVDHNIQIAVHQCHALCHIADRGIIGFVKQVVGRRVGLYVIERQRGVGELVIAFVKDENTFQLHWLQCIAWVNGSGLRVGLAGKQGCSQCQQQKQMISSHSYE